MSSKMSRKKSAVAVPLNPPVDQFISRPGEPIDKMVDFFRYIDLPGTTLVVMAAWIAASYNFMSFDRFPHLAVTKKLPKFLTFGAGGAAWCAEWHGDHRILLGGAE